MIRVEPGDLLDVIPRLVAEGIVCDACITDPPYHLTDHKNKFRGKCADLVGGVGNWNQGAMGRLARGFMGQRWDGGDIAYRPETWAMVASIMRPGAFLVVFGGTRTHHRVWCAIEDAGFVIQDTIAWLYGSGFPKRRDMLKPAFEPICLAYKPGGKRTMQVDECRISAVDGVPKFTHRGEPAANCYGNGRNGSNRTGEIDSTTGRWPANVCHDGSEEVTEAFAAFGDRAGAVSNGSRGTGFQGSSTFAIHDREQKPGPGDNGSAARFFYCAKADKQDRWGSRHPTVKPIELMKWLVPLVTPAGGLCLDPFAGSGTTGIAVLATGRDCILIEREEQYIADIRERLAFYEGGGTHSLQAKNRHAHEKLGPLI